MITLTLLLALAFSPGHDIGQNQQFLTPCDLAQNAVAHNGEIVTVRGKIEIMFEISRISDASCPTADIWLDAEGLPGPSVSLALGQEQYAQDHEWTEYALLEPGMDGRRYLAGDEFSVQWQPWPRRAAIAPRVDQKSKKLDRVLRIQCPCPPDTWCQSLGSPWSHVVVMTGRFEHVPGPVILRDSQGHRGMLSGFGHMSSYKSRLVLQSVEAIKSTWVGCSGERQREGW